MKILLTTLHSKYIHASLALPYLAGYCRDVCDIIEIEEYTLKEPKESILAAIMAHKADIICFSVYIWNRIATLELVACLKIAQPELRIVLGGPEVSFEHDDFFKRHPVDALVCGEGERPLYQLLETWSAQQQPGHIPGLMFPGQEVPSGGDLLDNLDDIPSPFALGLTQLERGLIYYETSRGCPYTCSFCMSSLDERVRSFSMERIRTDLGLLMQKQVELIKLVDRTFNYNSTRTREIFAFILEHNVSSKFHFEIGAHLLDQETLQLLTTVPKETFQFEIGVQSTLPQTLKNVGRVASLDKLVENVRYLVDHTEVHIHLDLIAGLPGEGFNDFLQSLDRVYELGGHQLQVEPVKLLPGAPLRGQAERWGINYDPNPPYTIIRSPFIHYEQLEKIRGIGRLLDLFVNSGHFPSLIERLCFQSSSFSNVLMALDDYWRQEGLYRQSLSLHNLYLATYQYLTNRFKSDELLMLTECLAHDCALNERIVSGRAPAFYDVGLSDEEEQAVRHRLKQYLQTSQRRAKVQYFASVFHFCGTKKQRRILIFIYPGRDDDNKTVNVLEL